MFSTALRTNYWSAKSAPFMLLSRQTNQKMIEEITPSLMLQPNKLTLNAWNDKPSLCKKKMTKKITYNQKNIGTIQKKEKEKKKILWVLPLGKGAPCMSQLPSSSPNKNPAVFDPLLFFFFFPCRVVLEGVCSSRTCGVRPTQTDYWKNECQERIQVDRQLCIVASEDGSPYSLLRSTPAPLASSPTRVIYHTFIVHVLYMYKHTYVVPPLS